MKWRQLQIKMNQTMNRISNNLILANVTVQSFRKQNLHAALGTMKRLTNGLVNVVQEFMTDPQLQAFELDMENVTGLLTGVMNAQENEDYVLVADLLELQMIPWLQQIQELLIGNGSFEVDENQVYQNLEGIRKQDTTLSKKLETLIIPQEYMVEPTSSGLLTLQVADTTGVYYFHSNNNPVLEGKIFAEQYYSIDCDSYIVFGLGLGYHIKALLDLDDGITIDIIEPDINVICTAVYWTDLSWIYDNPRVHLIYDQDYTRLSELLDVDSQLIIHNPSLRHVGKPEIKMQLEKFFVSDSGKRNLKIQFHNNYRDNVKNCTRYIDEIRDQFEGKNAIIVAAGPSLDKNVELLRNKPDNTVVVAVGTVFTKLVAMNLLPDYVVFLDAQPRLYQQIQGIENCQVPIICASTACKTIAQKYQGEKFLICQYGYDRAEEYVKDTGYQLYKTGGSVTTIALDMCIRLGCKEIAFIGLDLAYTGNQSHASHTADYHVSDEEGKIVIPAVGGGTVLASRLFVMYREWIERRIEQEKGNLTVIDATEGGALKNGMLVMSLQEVWNRWMK